MNEGSDEFVPSNDSSKEDRLDQIIGEYVDKINSKKNLDFDLIKAKHPDLGEEIVARLKVFMGLGNEEEKFPDLKAYRFIRKIGQGGVGKVYEAEQMSANRSVAVKILHRTSNVERFQRETIAIGRLKHPGIVTLYDSKSEGGVHYIIQELVEGGLTLSGFLKDQKKKEKRFPKGYFRQVVKKLVKIATALQYAHDLRVIHRDIKPSNILLTKDLEPKVSDFGLAKVEDAPDLTRTGEAPGGTPFYMSPEQARHRHSGIDRRTDIYSLGVTLYEMLTLKRPFEGKTSLEIIEKVIKKDPVDPQKVNPEVPRDLAVICMKAIEKKPEDRYQEMKDFSEDLERYLSGDVILAKPVRMRTRLWKRIKRQKLASGAIGIAVAAVLTLPWVMFNESRKREKIALDAIEKIKSERNKAINAEAEAKHQRDLANDRAIEIQKNYDEIMRLADLKRLLDLEEEGKTLWPAYPENEEGFIRWLERAENLVGRISLHQDTLDKLRLEALSYTEEMARQDRESHPEFQMMQSQKVKRDDLAGHIGALEEKKKKNINTDEVKELPSLKGLLAEFDGKIVALESLVSQRRTWKFQSAELEWRHNTLTALLTGLKRFSDEKYGMLTNVKERLDFAVTIKKRSIHDHQAAWEEAVLSIADKKECPRYDGLKLQPIIGFTPIGRDPKSGLWEFAHLQTGAIPERNAEGDLELGEEMGLVFVLIPGGKFIMGAENPSDNRPFGSPNADPEAEDDESPLHEVTLQPFFMSKYEMTQGQWLRFTKKNPSMYHPGNSNPRFNRKGESVSLLNPVEQVTWEACVTTLSNLNLRLPTESEWEYACRADTTTVWWTGNHKESLKGAANLSDHYCHHNGGASAAAYEPWLDDGYSVHSKVGGFKANGFGIHDICGNVWEWCQDSNVSYINAKPDGSAFDYVGFQSRVKRGGGWYSCARHCRSAYRGGDAPNFIDYDLGVRPVFSLPMAFR